MKKILVFLCMFLFMATTAYATESQIGNGATDIVNEQFNQINNLGIVENTPKEAQELLEEMGEDLSLKQIIKLTPKQLLSLIIEKVKSNIKYPIKVFSCVIGVIVICGIMSGLKSTFSESSLNGVFSVVSVLCVVILITQPIIDIITYTGRCINDCSNFILSFIPVYAGIMTAGGYPITAGTYNLFLFSVCQIVSQIASTIFVPLMSIYFGLCIMTSAMPNFSLSSITSGIKNFVTWGLGLVTTIFVGLLSIQTLVSQGADTVSTRTTKFIIGSFVPVVGGVLSDALGTAHSCLKLMKNSVGAFGIVIALLTFVPLIVKICVWYLLTNLSSEIAKLVGVNEIAVTFSSASKTLAILIAIVMCFGLLIIVSTTIIMLWGMG